jgi:DNA polymerase I-like protein with 3'-5' exonuclease and polymerase domains
MSKSNIKKCFTSRFEDGWIVEMDFAQLEIIGLAILSGDKQLKTDLKNGMDLHCVNTASLYDMDYNSVRDYYLAGNPAWTEKRKTTKTLSFQLQYGAGYKSMAESAGVSEKIAKKFISVYYDRYPTVKEWQDDLVQQVQETKTHTSERSTKGYPVCVSVLPSATGRRYRFKERDSPDFMAEKGVFTSFLPPEIKNYPVQGFSTGDFMALALARVLEFLGEKAFTGNVIPINTIHDSIIFDAKKDVSHKELSKIHGVLERTSDAMNAMYPLVNFDLETRVDVEIGKSWHDMSTNNFLELGE